LLLAALSGSGNVPGELGVALVAGANLGAGLIALGLTHQGHIESRRIVAANLLVRGALALVVLAFLLWVPLAFAWLGSETPRQVVNAHLLFNVVVLAIGVPCAGPLGRLMSRVLKLRGTTLDAERHALEATRLDASLMGAPALALASATRELLRMAEVVERMLIPLMDIYETGDPEKIREAKRLEAAVDRAQSEIKLYLARVDYGGDDDLRQGRDLSAIAINFEYVGDAIAKTLLKLAQARYQRSLQFSAAGWRELTELHQRVVSNMRLAQHVLVSRDMQTARQLLDEKTMMDAAERASQLSHLERLQEGAAASLQTSNIHLETIRALKTINSLVASVAYLVVREQTATIGDAANGRVLA
jgi:phosphate:Na+ symporter